MSRAVVPQFKQYPARSRKILAYVLAVVLPLLSAFATNHFHVLQPFPMGLQFLSMALVATLGGLGPALTVVFLAIVTRLYYLAITPHSGLSLRSEVVRFGVVFLGALIISILSRRRRLSEERLEVALTELQERSDALVESLSSNKCASWVLDLDVNETIRWHEGSYPVFGRPFRELESMPSLDPMLYPEDRAIVVELLRNARHSSEPFVSEYRTLWPNGEVHWLEMRGTRIPGSRCRWRGVTLDITERKLSEAALLRSEKLAAMGRLASTVAHEINNPLEAVTNLLYLASADDTLDPTTRTYVSMAERELGRLGNITRLTLGFVRTTSDIANIEISESVEDVLSILRHRFDSTNISIERHYEPHTRISIPPHELRQIATNLIANASDAVSSAGRNGKIAVRIAKNHQTAILTVEDNGAGIPTSNLQRIFDPFFSTKKEVGTGIGLWVTKEIVEKNGGTISVESGNLPSGFHTSFRVEFPLAS
jgi:PAS domain S-box-containing protein